MDALSQAIKSARDAYCEVRCSLDEQMKDHTSFRIGGPVRAMFFPSSAAELAGLYGLLCSNGVKPLVLGNGTNMLAYDGRLELITIKTTGLCGYERIGETGIKADAGVPLSTIAVFACQCGLAGMEFAHGIPGTLGGAVKMNAGAYGGEMKDVLQSTCAISAGSGLYTITSEEHGFSYRHSRFMNTGEIVCSSLIKLEAGDTAMIRTKMDELSARRRESQPLELPSAGSVFKRPKTGYAASLIEQAGLKGYRVGGAQVSEKHAGFIVNRGAATFSDVMSVIDHVRETVLRHCGVELEPEVYILSEQTPE